jgi:TolA-binding protein
MPKETRKEDIRRNPLAVWVTHAIRFYQERKRITLGVVVALVVTSGAGAGYFWYQEHQERDAQVALARAQASLKQAEKPDTRGDAEAAKKGLMEVINRFPGTVAAEESQLRLGNMQYDSGKYDEAIATFGAYLSTHSRGQFRVLAAIGKAYAEEGKGNLEASTKTLAELVATVKDDPMLGEAYSDLARFYEEAKKTEDALRMYGQIAERFPQTQWAQHALRRMAELKTK